MDTLALKNGSFSRKQIENIVLVLQNYLNFDGNRPALLMALSGNETSFGAENIFSFEFGWSRSSLAFKRSKLMQQGWELWGDLVCGSYSPWQCLWISAVEQGYSVDQSPLELINPNVSLPFVIKILNKNILSGAKTVEEIGIAWNAGLGNLKTPSADAMKYAKRLRQNYESLYKVYQSPQTQP